MPQVVEDLLTAFKHELPKISYHQRLRIWNELCEIANWKSTGCR